MDELTCTRDLPWTDTAWTRFLESIWFAIDELGRARVVSRFEDLLPPALRRRLAEGRPPSDARPVAGFVIAATCAANQRELTSAFVDFDWLASLVPDYPAADLEGLLRLTVEDDAWGIRVRVVTGLEERFAASVLCGLAEDLRRGVAGSVSLSLSQREQIIDTLPRLSESQIRAMLRIFDEERVTFAARRRQQRLQLQAKKARAEWDELVERYSH